MQNRGKYSKNKGDNFERDIALTLSSWWGSPLRRAPLSGGWVKKGFTGDIIPPDNVSTFPLYISVKNREGWDFTQLLKNVNCSIIQWWIELEQSETAKNKFKMLIFTKNYDKEYLILSEIEWKILVEITSGRISHTPHICILPKEETGVKTLLYILLLQDFLNVVKSEELRLYWSSKKSE